MHGHLDFAFHRPDFDRTGFDSVVARVRGTDMGGCVTTLLDGKLPWWSLLRGTPNDGYYRLGLRPSFELQQVDIEVFMAGVWVGAIEMLPLRDE
eukprot:2252808-Rhodomonas_salina.2